MRQLGALLRCQHLCAIPLWPALRRPRDQLAPLKVPKLPCPTSVVCLQQAVGPVDSREDNDENMPDTSLRKDDVSWGEVDHDEMIRRLSRRNHRLKELLGVLAPSSVANQPRHQGCDPHIFPFPLFKGFQFQASVWLNICGVNLKKKLFPVSFF